MLQVDNVVKKYGTETILRIPSLWLEAGVYWIKGANGSGKTTFLKMVAGLLPFEGDIQVNGISSRKKPVPYRQQISWSEAEPLFPSFMTGYDLVKLYSHIRKAAPAQADSLIDLFSMNDYISTPVGTYSAGMTKKLSLLLCFLGSPSLLLLDEPLITLDTGTVTAVCNYLVKRHQDNSTSFLISSHQDVDPQLLTFHKEFQVHHQTLTEA